MTVEDGLNGSAGQRVSQETVSAVSNSKPFAPIKMINDKFIDMLFDTGSNSSLLSIDILEAIGIEYTMEKCDEVLQGVEGTPLQIMGTTVLKTTFNNQSKNIRFTVLKDKDVGILGLKAMNQMRVLIDTERSLLCCNGLEQPFLRTSLYTRKHSRV